LNQQVGDWLLQILKEKNICRAGQTGASAGQAMKMKNNWP